MSKSNLMKPNKLFKPLTSIETMLEEIRIRFNLAEENRKNLEGKTNFFLTINLALLPIIIYKNNFIINSNFLSIDLLISSLLILNFYYIIKNLNTTNYKENPDVIKFVELEFNHDDLIRNLIKTYSKHIKFNYNLNKNKALNIQFISVSSLILFLLTFIKYLI
jgi:hypothetical protein